MSPAVTVLVIVIVVVIVLSLLSVFLLRLHLRWPRASTPTDPWVAVSYFSRRVRRQRRGITDHDDEDENSLPLKFHEFIRTDVIYLFNQQRVQGDQFAVLFFVPQGMELENVCMTFHTADNQRCLTHASYLFWPPDPQEFGNFMVARPEHSWGQHAEDIILEQFPELWEAYQQEGRGPPECVILYSWLMPCTRCTPKIIEQFTSNSDYRKSTKFIVVYTVDWIREEATNIRASKRALRNSEVIVERVSYDRRLPASMEEQRRTSTSIAMMEQHASQFPRPASVEYTPPPNDLFYRTDSPWTAKLDGDDADPSDGGSILEELSDLNLDDNEWPPLTN